MRREKQLMTGSKKRRIAFDDELFKQVRRGEDESWIWRFRFAGRQREMGLGAVSKVSLAAAREQQADWRKVLHEGRDPIAERRRQELARTCRQNSPSAAASGVEVFSGRTTFRKAAQEYIESRRASWTNDKSYTQWTSSLSRYVYPEIGDLPWSEVRTNDILGILRPIWATRRETAARVRGRIEAIINASAITADVRDHPNPARWVGHLQLLLSRSLKPKHYPAMPWPEVPNFMSHLRTTPGVSARALEFQILTAARSGMVRLAQCKEIDLENRVWNVPKQHMKGRSSFKQPLSSGAVELLLRVGITNRGPDELIFPSPRLKQPLSDTAMRELTIDLCSVHRHPSAPSWLDRNEDGIERIPVPHGFRSSFRDWAGDTTIYPAEIAEAALAHKPPGKVQQAYRRGDALELRTTLLEEWSEFCDGSKPSKLAPSSPGSSLTQHHAAIETDRLLHLLDEATDSERAHVIRILTANKRHLRAISRS